MFLDPLINRANASIVNYPEALSYLQGRGITSEDIKKYRLGYTVAPFVPVALSDPDYVKLKETTKDFFFLQRKVFFPLENAAGLVNGLVTRSIEKDNPYRYNQKLMEEASKIGAFFGLPQALPHILEKGVVYVTEGAVDCISLAKVKPNTVSVLTSFINEEQMWTLRMIADTIVIVFDPDEPGRKGVDIVMQKYGSKGIYSREFGMGDLNDTYTRFGEKRFSEIVNKALAGVGNFKNFH